MQIHIVTLPCPAVSVTTFRALRQDILLLLLPLALSDDVLLTGMMSLSLATGTPFLLRRGRNRFDWFISVALAVRRYWRTLVGWVKIAILHRVRDGP